MRGTLPWWLQEVLATESSAEAVPLEGAHGVDVAIVGGGYTGLWTALELSRREPSASVAVIDAGLCGGGASGRNGGFLHGYWHDLPRLRAVFGDEDARTIARAGSGIVPAVRALSEGRDDDVWLNLSGHMRVSTSPRQDRALARTIEASIELGLEHEVRPLTREDVARRCRSPQFRNGIFFPDCATVQPARLARTLRRAVIDAGVSVFEDSPVLRIESGGAGTTSGYRLVASGGIVTAADVVIATNAGCAAYPQFRREVTNFGSYMVITEPIPDVLEEVGWTGGEAVTDARALLHYFRTTPDGRVVMGTASGPIARGDSLGPEFDYDPGSIARACEGLRAYLRPVFERAQITHAWGGAVDITPDHYPLVGTLPGSRIHYGVGYSGHGTGPTWMAAKILAALVVESDDEWAAFPWVGRDRRRFPPDPLKYLGGRVVRGALLSSETAGDNGRAAASRLMLRIPQILGLPLGRD